MAHEFVYTMNDLRKVIGDRTILDGITLSFLPGPAEPAVVRCRLPARSLAVLYGSARYHWEHAILPEDVSRRRTSITLRTLSDALRSTPEGSIVLDRSKRVLQPPGSA